MRSLTRVVLLFTFSSVVAVSPAQQASPTAVPNLINYSGTLVLSRDLGAPATQNVTPDSTGHYTVLLGSTQAELGQRTRPRRAHTTRTPTDCAIEPLFCSKE